VLIDRIDAQPEDLYVPLVELGLELRHIAQLRRAHGREILGMGEQHRPRIADPVMEADAPLCGLRLEIRSGVAKL
jgi:hypothetical protein